MPGFFKHFSFDYNFVFLWHFTYFFCNGIFVKFLFILLTFQLFREIKENPLKFFNAWRVSLFDTENFQIFVIDHI